MNKFIIANEVTLLICLWATYFWAKSRLDGQLLILEDQYERIVRIEKLCKECVKDQHLDNIIKEVEKL